MRWDLLLTVVRSMHTTILLSPFVQTVYFDLLMNVCHAAGVAARGSPATSSFQYRLGLVI